MNGGEFYQDFVLEGDIRREFPPNIESGVKGVILPAFDEKTGNSHRSVCRKV